MTVHTKEDSTTKAKEKEKVDFSGIMESFMKEIGKMAKNMATVNGKVLQEIIMKEIG